MKDYNNDGERDEYDALRWDDEGNGGKGFKKWTPYKHPLLGDVEIGGFHPKFFSQNGPPAQLDAWASREARFNLAMISELPQIELKDVTVKKLPNNEFEIVVKWTNSGKLPVALEQAKLVKAVQEDRLMLDINKNLVKGKEPKLTIITPETFDKTIYAGYTKPGEKKEAIFRVKLAVSESVKIKVKLLSTRGGYKDREITLTGM